MEGQFEILPVPGPHLPASTIQTMENDFMSKLNRRDFIRAGSAAVTAGALVTGGRKNYLMAAEQQPPVVRSANDHIQIALIGAGGQGQGDASHATKVPGAKLVAVSDLYDSRLDRSKERWGNDIFTTKD
jgi:hypothetical protein